MDVAYSGQNGFQANHLTAMALHDFQYRISLIIESNE